MSLPCLPAVAGAKSNGLRSTDRCSHVAVRLPDNARRLLRQTLASTTGAAIIENVKSNNGSSSRSATRVTDVLKLARVPLSLVATLATLPSISEIPFLDCSFAITSPEWSERDERPAFAPQSRDYGVPSIERFAIQGMELLGKPT